MITIVSVTVVVPGFATVAVTPGTVEVIVGPGTSTQHTLRRLRPSEKPTCRDVLVACDRLRDDHGFSEREDRQEGEKETHGVAEVRDATSYKRHPHHLLTKLAVVRIGTAGSLGEGRLWPMRALNATDGSPRRQNVGQSAQIINRTASDIMLAAIPTARQIPVRHGICNSKT